MNTSRQVGQAHSTFTDVDIRDSDIYGEVESYAQQWYRPGSRAIVDALDIDASPRGKLLALGGVLVDRLEGSAPTRICVLDVELGEMRIATQGPGCDRLPKWSPDGLTIAYLSDRNDRGDWQLCFYDPSTGALSCAPAAPGFIEYFHWSPSGRVILVGVAPYGADVAGVQGGFSSARHPASRPAWMPEIETAASNGLFRSLWMFGINGGEFRPVPLNGMNAWEAVWCGEDAILAICSATPDEGAWYGAAVQRIALTSQNMEAVFKPTEQLGWPSATPTGSKWAVVEGLASDRCLLAGHVLVFDGTTGRKQTLALGDMDATFTHWLDEKRLLVAGVRGLETVIASIEVATGQMRELFASEHLTCGERFPSVCAAPGTAAVYCKLEGFISPPALVAIDGGAPRTLATFMPRETAARIDALGTVEEIRWKARDDLDMQGYLLKPHGHGPFPLIMMIHGGPIWQWRPHYLAKPPHLERAFLRHQYAVFQPNPRGSSGRGLAFASLVRGDMGGEDAMDCLAGLDELVKRGIADNLRLGVMGVSYGGFMSSWIVTQNQRFAAAASISPVTDWVAEELTSHIPVFCRNFLQDTIGHIGGRHTLRSPIMFAHQCSTPTLNACGALDHNTPPTQALEFHRALLSHGCESVLLTYPLEGHGCRQMPAQLDLTARVIAWFEAHTATSVKSQQANS